MSDKFWRIGREEIGYIEEAIELGFKGEFNKRLEEKFADRFGVRYAIAVNSGNSALHSALLALGVKEGDEVITTPLTFASPTFAILYTGATPVFADIDERTFTIDPEDIERKITPRTKAIIPVSIYGLPADMEAIMAIAKKHGLLVVEDNAECFLGAINGKLAGTFGDASIFSFERSKHMTTGNGGVVVTDSEDLATRIRKFSILGYTTLSAKQGQFKISLDSVQHPDFKRHECIGFNYRLPEVCAAMALAQLEKLDELVELRCRIAEIYREAIAGCDWMTPQFTPPGYKNTYWTFVIKLDFERLGIGWDEFRKAYLDEGGERYYAAWSLTYLEPLFSNDAGLKRKYPAGICPVAERVQPTLIQLKTNFQSLDEAKRQAEVLKKLIAKLGR